MIGFDLPLCACRSVQVDVRLTPREHNILQHLIALQRAGCTPVLACGEGELKRVLDVMAEAQREPQRRYSVVEVGEGA